MKDFRHGFIVGKFRPPHLGHMFLIRSAARFCDRVTVGVFDTESSSLPLAKRAEIIRQTIVADGIANVVVLNALDDIPVDYDDPDAWDKHVAVFRSAVEAELARVGESMSSLPIDVVFSSEAYGAELARRMGGATAVCLDMSRQWMDVSASRIKAAPDLYWELLPPLSRAAVTRRVVILGAESTGTTTLANDLCSALRTRGGVWARTQVVPEFGRELSQSKLAVAQGIAAKYGRALPTMENLDWTEDDFIHIGREQNRWEDEAAATSSPLLVCDTDALATTVWHERYRGCPSDSVVELASRSPARALYVLTDETDVPFVQDGLRDGEHIRTSMNQRFEEVLKAQSSPWFRIQGTREQRLTRLLGEVDSLLAAGLIV